MSSRWNAYIDPAAAHLAEINFVSGYQEEKRRFNDSIPSEGFSVAASATQHKGASGLSAAPSQ